MQRYYSNKARGLRRKRQASAAAITPIAASAPEPEPDDFRRHCKRAWARLIRKVYFVDPVWSKNSAELQVAVAIELVRNCGITFSPAIDSLLLIPDAVTVGSHGHPEVSSLLAV